MSDDETLAAAIVRELLSISGDQGTRMAIMQRTSDGSERDLGGRESWAAERTVQRVLDEWKVEFQKP